MKRFATRPAKAQLAAAAVLMVATILVLAPAKKAQAQYQDSGWALREKLIGGWGFVQRMQDGSELRISFTLASNGQFAGWMKVTSPNGRSREHTNYGKWTVQGTNLIVATDQGPVRHPVQFIGKNIRVYVPAFKTTLTFVPAGVYVIGPDGKRYVVDRV